MKFKALPDNLFGYSAEGVAQGPHPAVVLAALNAGVLAWFRRKSFAKGAISGRLSHSRPRAGDLSHLAGRRENYR